MKRLLSLCLCLTALSAGATAASTFPMTLPWNDSSNTAISLSAYVNRDIDAEGYVSATGAGHFAVNSGRIKFWGTNTTFGGNFPSKANAPQVAGRLAKYGFNIIRFHHMDMYDIWTTTNPDRVINPSKLDLLDYFIYSLKQHGIYADINLVVSRPFNQGTDLPSDINLITDWKVRDTLGFFDQQTRQLQKDYARDLLTHVNPYTGNAYINEPAVAFIEINNETGLTHAYLGSQLDPLPPYYAGMLRTQWNDWLKARYASHAALETAWGAVNQPLGAQMLTNGTFASGVMTPWNAEQHDTAVMTASVETGTGPGGLNCARINVSTAGTADWHVQLNHGALSVTAGVPYTVTFYAKADTNRTIDVSLMMANGTYANLGFSAQLNLTASWQLFTFTFTPNQTYSPARINFGSMGMPAGAGYFFTDISMRTGGLLGLEQGEDLYGTGINNFLRQGGPARTAEGQKDWYRFLQETEEAYWLDMYDYIKNTLGARALVFGTIIGCSTPNVQAKMDAVDTHSYWMHPNFPGTPWDPVDWYVGNYPMVNNQQGSTVANLGMKAVLNKPHLVTEYNHPHPNSYESEAMFFLSTYGSLQDWDALFPFDYNSSDTWNAGKIENFFAINQNPVKMASMIPAALAFYRGDISPATQVVVLPINEAKEIDELVTGGAWQLVDGAKIGENPKSSLIHKVRIAVEGQTVPGGSIAQGATDVSGNVMTSDTGQVVWDMSNTAAGFVKVDTAMTKMVYGFQNGRTYYLSGVTITPGAALAGGFSSIAVSALDGNSFASATRILVTALGTQQNTGASFYTYPNTPVTFPPAMNTNVTLRNQWGNSPALPEGIPAVITLPCAFADTSVWALNATGARASLVPVVNSGGFASFIIAPSCAALWYEVEVSHPEYTPSATATGTPVQSPTNSPTVSPTLTPVTGDMVDDCENTGSTQNLWSGYWYTYNDVTSTASGGKEYPGGPVTGLGKYHASGNLYTGGYAGIGTNLAASGGEADISAFEGLQMYIKGDGTPVHIAIVTGNFSDVSAYNNWEYLVPTTASWTLVKIPFSSMTQPYGAFLPFDLTRAEDIQWKIEGAGAFDVEIDDVEFYYPVPTATVTPTITRTQSPAPTATFTGTATATFTRTITSTITVTPTVTETITGTPPTETVTPTVTETETVSPTDTVTETWTPSLTATDTATPLPTFSVTVTPSMTRTATGTRTVTPTFTITRTRTVTPTPTQTAVVSAEFRIDRVFSYPQPLKPGTDSLTIRFDASRDIVDYEVSVYTAGSRLIRRFTGGIETAGTVDFSVPAAEFENLGNGTYYYYIKARGSGDTYAASGLKVLILIK